MKYCAHDYQAYATDFVLSQPYCGLILDMRLGKSVITLTALWDLLLDSFDVGCVLVVAPKRVAEDTWPREIAKWEHLKGLTYSLVMGSEKERRAALSRKAMIYIINRENVNWLVEHTTWRFDALVIDVVLHRCAVTGLTQTSVALAEQVTTIDKAQLQNRVGAVLDEQLMEQITHALQVQIGAVDAG